MQEHDSFAKFVRDFYDYAVPRLLLLQIADDPYAEQIISIHHNTELRELLLEFRLDQNDQSLLIDNHLNFMYVYLQAVFNSNEPKKKALENHCITYKESRTILCSVVLTLAYNYQTQQFSTDDLLINMVTIIDHGLPLRDVISDFYYPHNCPFPELYVPDYDIKNAVRFLISLLAMPRNNLNIPYYLVFAHPEPDDESYQFGLSLLKGEILKPIDILYFSLPPKNNHYRLLNHCVEKIVENDEKLFANKSFHYSWPGHAACLIAAKDLWLTVLHEVPAALYHRDGKDDCIKAARLSYKPAKVRCLVRNSDFGEPLSLCLNNIHTYWLQGMMGTGEALKAIAVFGLSDVQNYLSPNYTPNHCNQRYLLGGRLAVAKYIPCFAKRLLLLSEICAANHLLFLTDILYRIILELEDLSSLSVDDLFLIINTAEGILNNSDLAKQFMSRLSEFGLDEQQAQLATSIETRLNEIQSSVVVYPSLGFLSSSVHKDKALSFAMLFQIIQSLTDLTPSQHERLHQWLSLDFGQLLILKFIDVAMKYDEVSEGKKLTDKMIKMIIRVGPRELTTWSLALLHNYISEMIWFDEKLMALYMALQHHMSLNSQEIPIQSETHQLSTQLTLGQQCITNVARLIKEGQVFSKYDESTFTAMRICYEDTFLHGMMNKERYDAWLFVMRHFIRKCKVSNQWIFNSSVLSYPSEGDIVGYIKAAVRCQDWKMLTMLWKMIGDAHDSLRFLSLRHYSAKDIKAINSILRASDCIVTTVAPVWWQDIQRETFCSLQLQRSQLINLCQVLMTNLDKIPKAKSTSRYSFLFHSSEQLNSNYKNTFVSIVKDLEQQLSDYKIDINRAEAELVNAVYEYRRKLIINRADDYLHQIDKFFELSADATRLQIEQRIITRMQQYNIELAISPERKQRAL